MSIALSAERCALSVMLLALVVGCGGGNDATAPVSAGGTALNPPFTALPKLDPAVDGSYEAWAVDGAGQFHPLGKFEPGTLTGIPLTSAARTAAEIWITIEPPGDNDTLPSNQRLL